MPSFNTKDYRHIFELGRSIYFKGAGNVAMREMAVELMVMAESVIGQQSDWPKLSEHYRLHRRFLSNDKTTAEVIELKRK
jgi:hypothetical protein